MPRIQAKNTSESVKCFSNEQLKHFGNELRQAGSFDALMIDKQAARYINHKQFTVMRYSNPRAYAAKHLTGVYAAAPFHTDIPYHFWEQMLMEWREFCKK